MQWYGKMAPLLIKHTSITLCMLKASKQYVRIQYLAENLYFHYKSNAVWGIVAVYCEIMTHKYSVWKDASLVLNVEAGGTYRYNCPE
jgi:hypothetical protein